MVDKELDFELDDLLHSHAPHYKCLHLCHL